MVRGFIAEVGDIEHFDITYTRPCRVEIEGVLLKCTPTPLFHTRHREISIIVAHSSENSL